MTCEAYSEEGEASAPMKVIAVASSHSNQEEIHQLQKNSSSSLIAAVLEMSPTIAAQDEQF